MIKNGVRVECIDKKSSHFGKAGTFIGFLSNGLKVKFDDGTQDLFLASSLKKLKEENDEFEEKIKEYLRNNLSIEIENCGGQYGSNSYKKISLKLKDEEFSTAYIND